MVYFRASFYYVRYSILRQIMRELFRDFHWRIFLVTLLFILLFFVHQFILLFFRTCDALFYSNFRKVKIKEPVFIIANPRSGTTYLHRLISNDGDRFTYMKFAHTLFPSVSFVQFALLFKWIDDRTGRHIRRTIDRLDDRLYGSWDDVHAMGFNKPEEDEAVFAMPLMSAGIFLLCPHLHKIPGTNFLDNEPKDVQKNVMDFYESSVKRYVYATGQNKIYLSKNVMSTGRFKCLLERFPDAKIIYLARHPYEALPSFANMFSSVYKLHSPDMPDSDPAKTEWAELGIQFYLYLAEMHQQIPKEQFVALKYEDLISKPKETVLSVYKHFDWEVSESFSTSLDALEKRNKNYKSTHEYSLEQFGLSKEYINQRLRGVMQEFNFEME